MEKVLARRFRPQTFEEVIGQEAVVRTLRNALAAGRVGHGFIFSGPRGVGKTTVARILAKAMNCRRSPGPTATPCGECESCREIREGNAVDVIEIDAASNRGIDEIRALRESVRYRPARDRFKFYILDEAHQLTEDAFNALLKTLEEPPEWAVFVLATTEPEALPATIRSRCQHFAFRAVAYARIVTRLRDLCRAEDISAEDEALSSIASASEGSLRDALSLLDQALAYGAGELRAEMVRALVGRVATDQLAELLAAVADGDSRRALETLDGFLAAGASPAQLCQQLVRFSRDMLMSRLAGAASELLALSDREREATAQTAARFGEEDLTRFLQVMLRTAGELRFAPEPRLHLELGVMKMLQARRLAGIEEVLAALRSAAGSEPPAAEKKTPPTAAWTSEPAPAGGDPRARVLARLEELKKTSWLSLLRPAHWHWQANRLELIYGGETADLAPLARQEEILKGLREVIRETLHLSPEILVRELGGERAESAAAPSGPAEERAARHPGLRELRERLPGMVLRTMEVEARG